MYCINECRLYALPAHSTRMHILPHGVSLLECCFVVAILACMVSIGFSHITFLYKLQVQSEVEQLHAQLQSLQQKALATNTVQRLTVDTTTGIYQCNDRTHTLISSLRFDYPQGALGPPSAPTHPITKACTFADSTIIFWPDGIIGAGTIYITDTKKRYSYALSSGIGTISSLRIYEYKQDKWFCKS